MPGDADFTAYVAARWPRLVRALVLLGGSPAEADAVARGALARLRPGWRRAAGEDPDVRAWGTLLEDWRARPWTGAAGPPVPERLAALEPALDRLRVDDRVALVLRAVGGLSDDQVARVLGRPPGAAPEAPGGGPDEAALRSAAEEIDVGPVPEDAALAATRRPRRARPATPLVALVVALVALVLGAGVVTWLTTRPAEPTRATAGATHRVTRVDNAADVVWWSVGNLHLPHADVAFPDVAQAVRIGDGAVVADGAGVVSTVSAAGTVAAVGHLDPGTPLVGSDEAGWVAWADPTQATPTLVVYDVGAGAVLARLPLGLDAGEVTPVALDRGLLFYVDARGNWQWEPGHDDPLHVLQPGLLDVRRATEARRLDLQRVEVVQPFFNVVRVVAGVGGQLSPEATYLLTRAPGSGRLGRPGAVRVYDVRSGRPTWTGLTSRDVAVQAALGPGDEVHYLLVRASNLPHTFEVRTCDLARHRCRTDSLFNAPDAPPLLAR